MPNMLLFVAESVGLFSACVLTKVAHEGIHAGVDLYNKIKRDKWNLVML